MSMPNIPEVNSKIDLTTAQASNVILASIGFEELGLAHIINAEGEKIQSYLGTLEGQEVKKDIKIEELRDLDNVVNDTLKAITKKELLLLMKLEETKDILANEKTHVV